MVTLTSQLALRIIIVRDRLASGGGIHTLFEALRPHLGADVVWVDVGRSHAHYGAKLAPWWQRSRLRWLVDAAALAAAILRHRPALVHLNTGLDKEQRALKRDALNLWIARSLRCKVLVQWHGWDHPAAGTPEFPGGHDGWLCRNYRKAAGHIVLASAFRDDLTRWGFERIHVGTTVVPEEYLDVAIDRSHQALPPQILFLSRVERAKGLWELLEAYAILKRRNFACSLTIAGDGPDLTDIKCRAEEMGLDDISFPGFVTGEAKIECFQRASVFCVPSHSEGMPLAVLEAMAMGLPIVGTPVGGLADILRDGENGFLVRLEGRDHQPFRVSPEILAEKIEKLLLDSELRLKIGRQNQQEARDCFTPAIVTKNLEGIYYELALRSKVTAGRP